MRFAILVMLVMVGTGSFCQKASRVINVKEVSRIEAILSADSMQGRRTGTPGIEKAADFISREFAKAGLSTFNGAKGFRQEFTMIKPVQTSLTATINNNVFDEKNVVVFTSAETLTINQPSTYKKAYIKPGSNLVQQAFEFIQQHEDMIVVVDTSFSRMFPVLNRIKRSMFKSDKNVVFLLTQTEPTAIQLNVTHKIEEQLLANVVGVLPGKSKKGEYVIFSGHYDHLGIGKPVNGDSIYNGANDDAAGITAVIMLAKYYKALGNNERTLVFAAFTAEETGGFGSQYFSRQLEPSKVAAMFNVEMIGTESKWGRSSAYITGYEKTNMGAILEKNLQGTAFRFYPDPYPDQELFYRSDNATLARLGVPAHTISTSKMDNEANYHKVSDEIGTLDMANMTEIIKAIATSATTIVNGKDTPTRVKVDELVR